MKIKFLLLYSLVVLTLGGCIQDDVPDPVPPPVVVPPIQLGLHTYYVSPTGSDTDSGTVKAPFQTVQRAQTATVPGDIVYIHGGNYLVPSTQIVKTDGTYAYCNYLDKSGTATARIQYLAYPGEKPVFDYSNVKPVGLRVTAFFVKASYITIKGLDVTGVQVTITTHTQSESFRNEGSNNIYEGLRMHDSKANGFYLTKGGNNLILNCDAFNNWDDVSEDKKGGNVDGFGCHPNKQGLGYTGNVFRGCRAWFNSDDGFDCINAFEAITYENCWSFDNGYSTTMTSLGDGNGFKGGGFGVTDFSNVPATIPRHTFRFCLAVSNKSSGFYANHHLGGSDWYNNTAYKNNINYNMLNRSTDYASDVSGYGHVLKNNLGYKARTTELANLDSAKCTLSNNYFQLTNLSITDADFVSLDLSLLTQARNADYTLPSNNFLRLAPGSDLIDKGIDIGFPFKGARPDLGCFEF
jgi:parallel beta-helix repeat protein